ncbi:MAG: SagB/ThcOx family dehydrogenase [Deltaproteobacteria bacterium]|nr:SagB/ThcOx family dehydrogenase [Deltaproteobacteria bacterium]
MPTDDGSSLLRRWRNATDLSLDRLEKRRLDWAAQPESHKAYPDAPRRPLPRPAPAPANLWSSLDNRRSRRDFTGEAIPLSTLAALLWACQGVTGRHGPTLLRTAPSAGALYPFETYLSLQAVEGESPCLAHLHLPSFSLEILREDARGTAIAQAALGQGFLAQASAVLLWTAVYPRAAWKYGDRALRYLGLDLGHVAQNLCLAAEALGLGCCPVAAFLDDEVNAILDVDGNQEFAYYLAAIGRRRR